MINYDARKIQPNESVSVDTTVDIAAPKGFDVADTAVAVAGRLKNTGKAFVLEAQADCQLETACSRCLQPVEIKLFFHINENYVDEGSPDAKNDEDIVFRDNEINLFPAVQRNLLLNIPMKPLCAVDCAGLCPKCGKNLNEGDCGCEGEINEQFRELLQIKFDDS